MIPATLEQHNIIHHGAGGGFKPIFDSKVNAVAVEDAAESAVKNKNSSGGEFDSADLDFDLQDDSNCEDNPLTTELGGDKTSITEFLARKIEFKAKDETVDSPLREGFLSYSEMGKQGLVWLNNINIPEWIKYIVIQSMTVTRLQKSLAKMDEQKEYKIATFKKTDQKTLAQNEQEKEKATNILDENIPINEADEKAKVDVEKCKNSNVETARFDDLDQYLTTGNEQDLMKQKVINEEVTQQKKISIDNHASKDSYRVDQDMVTFAVQLIENVFNDLQIFLENNTVIVYSDYIESDLDHEVELYGQLHQAIEVM